MRVLIVTGFSVALGVTAAAQGQQARMGEKPSREFQDLMKSNTAILAVDGFGTGAAGRVAEALKKGDFDAILKEATTLQGNFQKIEAFFAGRQMDDAVALVKTGLRQIAEMKTAAEAKDKGRVFKAYENVATTCRNCHVEHRVHVLTFPMWFEIR